MSKRLTRREMLKLSGNLVAGSLLASCTANSTPTEEPLEAPAGSPTEALEVTAAAPPAPVEGNVVLMYNRGELSEDEEAQFEADNPGITIEFIETDTTRFFAMYAAGTPPDLMRTQAPAVPQYLARGMLHDLTPYFEASEVLNIDDLAPANNYYKGYSPLEIGEGPIYGMVKDWSPDYTIFVNKIAFQDAGLDVPDDTKALSYQEISDLARQLKVLEGDRVLMWGYGYEESWVDRIWMNMLAEEGKSLYAEDFTAINLASSEEAQAVAKYYFDLASDNLTFNPFNPCSGWIGEDFAKGTLALCQYGYWFTADAESDITDGQVIMLPGPTWTGVRRDPTMTATGMFMAAASQVPDAAWKVFEWYNGLEPALDRARKGHGVPGLKSMYDLMPAETDFHKQVQRVLQAELALETPPLKFNPFITVGMVYDSWNKNLEQALAGTISFDDCLSNVEAEVNTGIQEGIDRIS